MGCAPGVGVFTSNAMHITLGHGHFTQHSFVGHAVIAIFMIGRHVALVSPKEMNILPGKLFAQFGAISQQLI